MKTLWEKITQHTAIVGVIGLGHTGLFLANAFRQQGFPIIGYDIDTQKIEQLKRGENYLYFFTPSALFSALESGEFRPSSDPRLLREADVIIISVPTPLEKHRMPDLTPLRGATLTAAQALHQQQLIVMQSTSFPGTVEELMLPILSEKGKKVGTDFYLAHVPEREDAGNPDIVLSHVPRLVGGVTPECLRHAKGLYAHITDKMVPCSSVKIAEAAKVFENAYRLINISFVNEMKLAFDHMGINCWEVIEMASTKPFGFTPFYPGPGVGGECIPVDPIYFSWKAHQYDAPTLMIDSATQVNTQTPHYIFHRILLTLNEKQKSLKGSRVLILGVAFKKNITDLRESPALRILTLLKESGAAISYADPMVPRLPSFDLTSIELNDTTLASFDCTVIVTDHDAFDWNKISTYSQIIIDTRHATKHVKGFEGKIVL